MWLFIITYTSDKTPFAMKSPIETDKAAADNHCPYETVRIAQPFLALLNGIAVDDLLVPDGHRNVLHTD